MDIDYLIASTTVNIANKESINMVGDNVDIFVLLVVLTSKANNVYFLKLRRSYKKKK